MSRTAHGAGLLLLIAGCLTAAGAPPRGDRAPRRARYPDWKRQPAGIFFDNAFEQGLVGPRPPSIGSTPPAPSTPPTPEPDQRATSGTTWSRLISAETIEDEIKSIQQAVRDSTRTLGEFKGQGYQVARRELSVAAVLFAVIAEYDRDVRWKPDAAAARDVLARASANAKVASTATFQEAKQRQGDLQDLISGGRLALGPSGGDNDWSGVGDRGPLMQRLEIAHQQNLSVWLAAESEFRRHRPGVKHEAELIAAMAEVLAKQGREDAEDAEYRQWCEAMQEAALEIGRSATGDQYQAARQANGKIQNSCTTCHEAYRS